MVVAVKEGRMTRRTLATTGYCTALQAAIGVMTLLTGSGAGIAGTVMDCRYDITCMTTNTVNRRAAIISVRKDVTEARIRMINWGVVIPVIVDRDMTVVTVLGPTGHTHFNNPLRGGGVAHIVRILMTDHAVVAGITLGMGLQMLDYRVAYRMTVITR
jgi:hypothetical protein